MEELIRKICGNCGLECHKIERSVSGFTNITHFVDDKYVIKVINSFTKPEKLKKEISFIKTTLFIQKSPLMGFQRGKKAVNFHNMD